MAQATLRSKATLDAGPFQRGLATMRGGVDKFAGSTLAGLGRQIGAAFAVGAVVNFARNQLNAADRTADLSNILGIQAEALQALEVSALGYGGTLQQVETGVKMLARAQGEALKGTRQSADAFERLGITQAELGTLGTEALLQRVANGFKAAGGSAQALSDLQIILGRSGIELAGVLGDIADNGLQGLIDKGKEAGTVLENDVIASLAMANNALEIMNRQATNWMVTNLARVGALYDGIVSLAGAVSAVGFEEGLRQSVAGEIGLAGELRKQAEAQAEARARQQAAMREQAEAARRATAEKLAGDIAGVRAAGAGRAAGIRVSAPEAADSLARRGGFIGASGGGMERGRMERALELAKIQADTLQKIEKLQAKAGADMARAADALEE